VLASVYIETTIPSFYHETHSSPTVITTPLTLIPPDSVVEESP